MRKVEDVARDVEALLDQCRVSWTAFISHRIMQAKAQNVNDRVYSQGQTLEMLDDILLCLDEIIYRKFPSIRFSILREQESLTETATEENERGK